MNRKLFLTSALATTSFALSAFQKSPNRATEPFVVPTGMSRSGNPMMKFMGMHPNDVIISRKDTDNALSVFLFTGYGEVGTPLHVHYHQDEFFTVLEGNYRFVSGTMDTKLGPGDTIFLPRNIPHQWLQLSDNGRLIYAVSPAGELEDFFKEVNNLEIPAPDKIDALALKHGMKHLGPPLTR